MWWGIIGTIYRCNVQNSLNITTLDEAYFDNISGTHLAGFNNDNIEGFYIESKGQIHYFPRGLNKFFKNLKGIYISNTGLKEIHQSDLKDFPNLMELYLLSSHLEILEENLFEFNPNLYYIHLGTNRISHIDPNVFDKLSKLKYLYLGTNICIHMNAENNPTEVQNVIKTAKAQCINSDYLKLEQQVRNLEMELKSLNLENFEEKLEKLENEITNSKFLNTFYRRLQDLKAAQIKEAKEHKIAKIIESNAKKMDRLESKLIEIGSKLEENEETVSQVSQKISSSDQKIAEIDEKVSKLSKDMSTTLKDIESANNQNFAAIMKFIENIDKKIEEKLSQIDDAQKKLMNKIHKIESEDHDDKVKINQKLRAILKAD